MPKFLKKRIVRNGMYWLIYAVFGLFSQLSYGGDQECMSAFHTGNWGSPTGDPTRFGSCYYTEGLDTRHIMMMRTGGSILVFGGTDNDVTNNVVPPGTLSTLEVTNIGTVSSYGIVNYGTNLPTLANCISHGGYTTGATSQSVPSVASNYYCMKLVGATHTGYMVARANSTNDGFDTGVTAFAPPIVSASISTPWYLIVLLPILGIAGYKRNYKNKFI